MYPSFSRGVEEDYITGTDIKNWVYCPLIVYYRKIMKAPLKLGSQQYEGQRKHVEVQEKIMRRVGLAIRKKEPKIRGKEFNVEILLEEEELYGLIDIVVITENEEIIPVEIKTMRSDDGKAWPDHRYQITYYALLLEKKSNKLIKRGYIYYCLLYTSPSPRDRG